MTDKGERKQDKRPRGAGGQEREGPRADERAAPPDAAGGQGSFTVPADVTQVGGDASNRGTPEHPAPDLHWGARTGAQKRLEEEPE
jgi:hypothetical protein